MTTTATETLTEAVLRRLREQMGGRKINQPQLSELTGWSIMYVNRRLNGKTPFDLRDLEIIEAATGISAAFLVTGHGDEQRQRPEGWVDGAALDGGGQRQFWVRADDPPPNHPMRRREDQVRALHSVKADEFVPSDSAMAYLKLAESSLLPRLDSNQEPSDCRHYARWALAS